MIISLPLTYKLAGVQLKDLCFPPSLFLVPKSEDLGLEFLFKEKNYSRAK